ncbi:MAG: hypothetical protein IKD35_04235 [Clostridia bacterium]|nr:hypothetical protein [Clostridia bacterium]
MKEFAEKYIEFYDSMPLWAKVLFSIIWAIPNGLYRFSKSALVESDVGMALAVIVTFFFGEILILVDIISLLVCKKLLWINNPKPKKD